MLLIPPNRMPWYAWFYAAKLSPQEQVTTVISEVPPAPLNLEETGVDPVFLLQLMLKGMFLERMEVPSQLAEALKLSVGIINKLLHTPITTLKSSTDHPEAATIHEMIRRLFNLNTGKSKE